MRPDRERAARRPTRGDFKPLYRPKRPLPQKSGRCQGPDLPQQANFETTSAIGGLLAKEKMGFPFGKVDGHKPGKPGKPLDFFKQTNQKAHLRHELILNCLFGARLFQPGLISQPRSGGLGPEKDAPNNPHGCGSKLNRKTKRRFWSTFPLTRVPFWYRFLEPQPHGFVSNIESGSRLTSMILSNPWYGSKQLFLQPPAKN